MSASLILISFVAYTVLLFTIAFVTSRKAGNDAFFLGERKSPWLVVAYGMIGASLSGVTFISVPGWVQDSQFSYLMVVFGYVLGYAVIAGVLLPLYYRLKLTSIYTYLEQRFGFWSYKTGAFYFLLSRIVGASFRMFLVINVLQIFVFDDYGVPFWITASVFILLIILYTFRGGIKTIVWTDTLQTTFMLLAVVVCFILIMNEMNLGLGELIAQIKSSDYSKVINTGFNHPRFFIKEFLSGAFIAIVMTGLDQDMMQKNLSCKNLPDAQKNMMTLSIVLVFVNLLFLSLGATLYLYAEQANITIPELTDNLFPTVALKYLGTFTGVVFIIGLISAAYSSADSALTSLTTSFSVDILNIQKNTDDKSKRIWKRKMVHFGMAAVLLIVIIVFRSINDQAIISKLFTIAGYTYGPLLGLYAFGLFTNLSVRDKYVPVVAILSPLICYLVSENSVNWLNGYVFGFELLILNGLLTFTGLLFISKNLAKS